MLGIKHTDRTPNDEVYQSAYTTNTAVRQNWIGHMLRREKEEPIRTYGLYEPKHELRKTRKGRPAKVYTNYVAGLISKVVKLSSDEIETAAQSRDK